MNIDHFIFFNNEKVPTSRSTRHQHPTYTITLHHITQHQAFPLRLRESAFLPPQTEEEQQPQLKRRLY